MMERSNRSKKFSFRYRIEKWLYEDSVNDFIKVAKVFGLFLLCLVGMAILFIAPALFH